MRLLEDLIACGNLKLPRTTAIFNMGSAHSCPSKKLGLCQAWVKGKCVCYAMKSETSYHPNTQPYRNEQMKYWLNSTVEKFVYDFLILNYHKRNKFTALRFNESGDFWDQECIDKADKIAYALNAYGIRSYGYTARRDLNFSNLQKLIVHGSGFYKEGLSGEFKMIDMHAKAPVGYVMCKGDCRICHMCLNRVKKICIRRH